MGCLAVARLTPQEEVLGLVTVMGKCSSAQVYK